MQGFYIGDTNLDKIAESGQCFRWRKQEDGTYIIPAFGRELRARQENEIVAELDCSREEFLEVWARYFDWGTDYSKIFEEIRTTEQPEYLQRAAKHGRGIRILRQELWETVVSFIISQNNNIPRIKRSIEKMCELYGRFPTKFDIQKEPEKLKECGLGYRDKYIYAATLNLGKEGAEEALQRMSYKEAKEQLLSYTGIGEKVANCICLYGLGHKEAFPRDVWIKRIEAEQFGGYFPEENYPGYAGILQQFIFYYERSRKNAERKAAR